MFQTQSDHALLALLGALDQRGYDFVTPLNPTSWRTHRRRRPLGERNLRDVLGWGLPFPSGAIEGEIEALLAEAGALREEEGGYRSTLRVSRLAGTLFLHSALGSREPGTVFLGPDSYRFAEFLRVELTGKAAARKVVEIGAGAGVGGVVAARLGGAELVQLGDVNERALRLARINAAHAGVTAAAVRSDGLSDLDPDADLVVANPPFIAASGLTHSDGGDRHGTAIALRWADEAMSRLPPGGRLLLYTGAPMVEGTDILLAGLRRHARERACQLGYRELDPDIFASELRREVYADVERIAAVGAVVEKL